MAASKGRCEHQAKPYQFKHHQLCHYEGQIYVISLKTRNDELRVKVEYVKEGVPTPCLTLERVVVDIRSKRGKSAMRLAEVETGTGVKVGVETWPHFETRAFFRRLIGQQEPLSTLRLPNCCKAIRCREHKR